MKNITINAKELRNRLSYYLDELEGGTAIKLIRHSHVVGTLQITDQLFEPEPSLDNTLQLADNKTMITFRQYEAYDREDVLALYESALKASGTYRPPDASQPYRDIDLEAIPEYYLQMGGDFLVGLVGEEIVAMGAYRLNTTGDGNGVDSAELKRMRVKSELQGQGIGSKLLSLLEAKAYDHGYKQMVLDTTNLPERETARRFYEKHGYEMYDRPGNKDNALIFYRKTLKA